jgi:hypothetical protein
MPCRKFLTCTLLGYDATLSGSSVLTFQYDLSVTTSRVRKPKKAFFLDFSTLEEGTNRLSPNISTEPPLNAVYYPRTAQISFTSQQKPEITHSS